jgi:hypothetical protein
VEIDRQAFETWKQLYSCWSRVRGRALKARFEVNVALLKCAHGAGPPPTRKRLITSYDAGVERLSRDQFDPQGLSPST